MEACLPDSAMAGLSDVQKIKKLIERSFDEQPWYGPSVIETIKDISSKKASNRLAESHSIIELVCHMTAWRNFVINQLRGNPREISEVENFPIPTTWEEALTGLKQSQSDLLKAIDSFPESRLNEKVPLREYRFHFMLNGIVQHDIYHIGQIALLKKFS